MKIESYKQAVKYLETFIRPTVFQRIEEDSKLINPLERMNMLLKLLGNPEKKFKSIVVSGTSGKGSTAYLISHILVKSGYKTGLGISPHLEKINERIQINEKQISDEELVQFTNSLVAHIEGMKREGNEPSYFEILMAITFLYFAEKKVDIAIVEVGLEGKYDATNVLNPLIFVLTNISLDHTAILGNTVKKIAREATSRIQKSKFESQNYQRSFFVVSGARQKEVIKIVEERCREVKLELFLLGRDFEYEIKKEDLDGPIFKFSTSSNNNILDSLRISMVGKYQVENASIAVQSVIQLQKFGFKILEKDIREALNTAFFAGRFEVIDHRTKQNNTQNIMEEGDDEVFKRSHLVSQGETLGNFRGDKFNRVKSFDQPRSVIILDGAHNPSKMKAFIEALKKLILSQKSKVSPRCEAGKSQNYSDEFHSCGIPNENYHRDNSKFKISKLKQTFINQVQNDKIFKSSTLGTDVGRLIFVVAFKKDKNIKGMLKEIVKVADVLIITQFASATDMSLKSNMDVSSIKYQVLSMVQKSKMNKVEIYTEKDSRKAIKKAIDISSQDDLIVVTGSLYLVGEIRSYIYGQMQNIGK